MKNSRIEMCQADISPEDARAMLQKNKFNRPLSQARVSNLADIIKRGEWELNGDAIRFCEDGFLLDGQHRLAAIAKSGVTVRSFIATGLDRAIFDTIDVGRKTRTASDIFSINGEKNCNTLAGACRMYYMYEITGNPFSHYQEKNPSVRQLEAVLVENPKLRDNTNWTVGHSWCRKHIAPSLVAFSRYLFMNHDADKGRDFYDLLDGGYGLSADSPILLLRNRLTDYTKVTEKMTTFYKGALIFKAFNLYCDEASVKNLKVIIKGDRAEKDFFKL